MAAAVAPLALCLCVSYGVAPMAGTAPAAADASNRLAPRLNGTSDFAVQAGARPLGNVQVFIYDRGLYVRPEGILPLIGVSVRPNPETGIILLQMGDGATIALDRENGRYTKDGDTEELGHYDLIVRDDAVLVNIDFLNRLLPSPVFLADRAGKIVTVSVSECGQGGQWCRIPPVVCDTAQACPLPEAPSNKPFVIDSAENRVSAPGLRRSFDTGDVVHMTTPEPPATSAPATKERPAAAESESDEIDTLILAPRIKNLPPKGDFIEVFDRGGHVFLPLNDAIQLFGFPIKIDKKAGRAGGYVFTPDNKFDLDIPGKRIQVGEKRFAVGPSDFYRKDDDIYVSAEAFAKWFEIDVDVDRKQQSLHFKTTHQLPDEESQERQARWQKLAGRLAATQVEFPLLDNPYRLIGYPAFDVNVNALYAHQTDGTLAKVPPASVNYNVQAVGDIAYATGRLYMAGATSGRGVDTLRFSVGRKDPDAALFGGLHATEFAVGDIASPVLSLVTTNSVGRGFMITNRAVDAAENFDVRSFTGDSVPGYQAELYRNDELIGFQTVGADGRYNFPNSQVLYGENVFRIVLYGPQGQKEERVETVQASASVLKPGQLQYSLGFDQRGVSLIPVTRDRKNAFTPVGLQSTASLRYGVMSNLTAGIFAAETALNDGDHGYYGANLVGNLWRFQAETIYVRDITNNGWAAAVSGMTSFYGFNVRAYYRKYDNFVSEAVNSNDMPLTSDMGIDTNAQALLPVIGALSYGFSAYYQTYEDKLLHPATSYAFRLAKNVAGIGFTNTVTYTDYPVKQVLDTFSFQSRISTVELRLSGLYQYMPYQQLQDINLTANYALTDALSGQTQVDKNAATDGSYNFSQTLYWNFEDFRLGFFGQSDTKGSFAVGLNLSFSMAHNPITDRWWTEPKAISENGIVAGKVYVKDDGVEMAGKPGKEQKPRVTIDNANATLDDDQRFMAARITPYRRVKVAIDPNSIADPLLSPEQKGYQVVTRPGSAALVDFPLIMTTTIEGTVFILDAQGKKLPVKNAVVELEDGYGKPLRRGVAEFDGYFSFDRVGMGRYRLDIPAEVLQELHVSLQGGPLQIDITKVTEFISNRDIILVPQSSSPAPTVPVRGSAAQ